MRVALVSATAALGTDDDEAFLLPALRAAGADPAVVVWDDRAVDWAAFDVVVLRSTWDYTMRRDEFLTWVAATDAVTRLRNRPGVVRWNSDKVYLRDLAGYGLPVVPTEFLSPGDRPALPDGVPFVVKPTVSAGSRNTARYAPGEQDVARDHARRLLDRGRTVMVQPYVASVDERGETALVFLGGRYSHAVTKDALLVPGERATEDKLFATEKLHAVQPSAAERAVADAVLDAIPFPRDELLYARVDLVLGADGEPAVLELELVEPSLMLPQAPPEAAGVLARTIVALAGPDRQER
ncbi:ATP-grasp domain-containing protein [Nakamurella sp.]|uniref:ATP-grasp domain-containing protein n=1 Tax=Nakamurella sp. TaxID=1869182 RepID=UPI003B3BB9C9